MQIITRLCCNKELQASCIHGWDKHYCTCEEAVTYSSVDMSCSGYVNAEVFRAILKEEMRRRDAEEEE